MGVVSRRWVWVESMGVASGCGCTQVYRFPHITYPYSSCICSFFCSSIPPFCSLTLGAMRAARVTVVVPCVYVCVSTLICCLTHWNHKREIPMDSLQYSNHFQFLPISLKMLRSKVMA